MNQSLSKTSLVAPLRLVFVMWLFFWIGSFTGIDFSFLGIVPRTFHGMIGIFTAPLIHGSFSHIVSNTIPLLFLGVSLYFFYPNIASRIFIQCYLFTSFFVWVFARPFDHIGASGLVYALAFFLIFLGLFRRDFKSLFLSIIIVSVYGGLVYGAFTFNESISWESHVFGAIVGTVSAYTTGKYSVVKANKNSNY